MFEMSVEADGVVRVSGRLDASVVLMIHKRLHAAGHSFRLVNLQPMVRNVITYAGLHRLLNIE